MILSPVWLSDKAIFLQREYCALCNVRNCTKLKLQGTVHDFYENTLVITLKIFILITDIIGQRIQTLKMCKDVNIEIRIFNMAA